MLNNRHAMVMTDKFEIASELLYQGDVQSTVIAGIGRRQWAMWPGGSRPARYLLVLNEPSGRDPAVMRSVAKECSAVHNGPVLRYAFAGPPVTMFYTKWCDR